jgi:hypothetical protein
MPDGPYDPGLLRAVRAEARREQRTRMLDQLRMAQHHADQAADATGGQHAQLTREGRRAAGLAAAIELLEEAEPELGDEWARITGDVDGVDLYWYDPPDEDEPEGYPVRLVVSDGADLVTAAAYLTLEEAEQAGTELLALVAARRRDRIDRAAIEASLEDMARQYLTPPEGS